jgi:hypothetical protein
MKGKGKGKERKGGKPREEYYLPSENDEIVCTEFKRPDVQASWLGN